MRVGLMQEAQNPPGFPPDGHETAARYHELVEEALLAEEMGFDFYGVGEQHFASSNSRLSSPDVIRSFIAAKTSKIRLRSTSTNLLPYNHPIRIAEQLATLDIMSEGRAELGCARSNNPVTLRAFGIDPGDTTAFRNEMLEIIVRALSEPTFAYDGEFYSIPEVELCPRPIQSPHPPIHLSSTSTASSEWAGKKGIGAMIGFTISWEHLEACLKSYWEGTRTPDPLSSSALHNAGVFSAVVSISETREEALEPAAPVILQWMKIVAGMYRGLSPQSSDYAYLSDIEQVMDHADDADWLEKSMPYFVVGTVDDLLEHAQRVAELGGSDLILRVDGMGHEHNMRVLELIGTQALPRIQSFSTATFSEAAPSGTEG